MNKKVLAIIAVTLFITSGFMAIPQAAAHNTLGYQSPTGPAQPMGTKGVDKPGALGLAHVDGQPNPDGGNFHVWGVDAEATVVYALPGKNYLPLSAQANYYSPDGAILTDTMGDMWFYINISAPIDITWETTDQGTLPDGVTDIGDPDKPDFQPHSKWFYIAIPPEFGVPEGWNDPEGWDDPTTENSGWGNAASVITSITNDYRYIQVGKFKGSDLRAPGWWFVRVSAPAVEWPAGLALPPNVTPAATTNSNWLYPAFQDPWWDRQVAPASFPTAVVGDQTQLWNSSGCYYIRVRGLTAPSIAGKYQFKVLYTTGYVNGWYEVKNSISSENYPVVVVKAEVDPAYIAGRVIYCAHTAYYYGLYYGDGVLVPGKVIAEGTSPEGRHVVGMGYFAASAEGYFEIEGLAPGTYTVTAHALGMVPYTLPQEITVFAGQSKYLTICVQPAFKIATTVFSKCPAGPIPFPDYVAMTSYPENNFVPIYIFGQWPGGDDGAGNPIWGGDPAFDTTTGDYARWGYYAQYIWDEDGGFVSNTEAGYPDGAAGIEVYPGCCAWDITNATGRWMFKTFFGNPTCYSGTPTMFDGHVPQEFASWTSGITPGTYTITTHV
ncbi:MAG: carboxypeptidase-like regulatory domain-containing protein, partial [Candidatus Bathyarchaeota archaeon]|nr:carboxypeptidase-like regulatory domain-containing protein [Candidatus Bathyarchaeota archaeon]